MKKTCHTLFLFLLIPVFSQAQLTPFTISTNFDDVKESVIGDIDGDGDMDIFFAFDDLYWYEQVDINQNLWALHSLGDSPGKLDLIDVDNDNDLDFVVHKSGRLKYFENVNSLGTQTLKHDVFEFTDLDLWKVTGLADLDNDGDLDFVSDRVSWAENTDDNFNFGDEQLIFELPGEHEVSFDMNLKDWDYDGDIDIILNLEVAHNINQVKLLRNQGAAQFGDPEILVDSFPSWNRALTRVIDVDNDMDLDIIVHNGPEDIVWFKNEAGSFGPSIFIHEYFDVPSDIEIVDIDNDGLLDIFWCGHGGVFWKANQGGFTFETAPSSLGPDEDNKATNGITFGDLDMDGDLDMVRMGRTIGDFPQRFRWYKNTYPLTTDVEEQNRHSVKIYPNPFHNRLSIDGTFELAEIYNSQGVKVLQSKDNTIDSVSLNEGMYYLKTVFKDGTWLIEKVVKF